MSERKRTPASEGRRTPAHFNACTANGSIGCGTSAFRNAINSWERLEHHESYTTRHKGIFRRTPEQATILRPWSARGLHVGTSVTGKGVGRLAVAPVNSKNYLGLRERNQLHSQEHWSSMRLNLRLFLLKITIDTKSQLQSKYQNPTSIKTNKLMVLT